MSLAFAQAVAEATDVPDEIIGLEPVMRLAYAGQDLNGLWQALVARTDADAADAAAILDMSTILLVSGHRDEALRLQALALQTRRTFRRVYGDGQGLHVTVLMTAGDFMANTPVEFLLSGSDMVLNLHYVDAETRDLADAPAADVLFVAIGESPQNAPVLARCAELVKAWRGPILAGAPDRIANLTRDRVAAVMAGEPAVLAPPTARLARHTLEWLAAGQAELAAVLPGAAWPLIVRPVGTHAGQGMEKVATPAALGAYLAGRPEAEFYLTAFIDYASPDGCFRKQRIAFIGGRAYPSHMAVSEHWMVHYLSAGMAEDPARRAEEAAWMASFDTDFAQRHRDAFEALHRRIGLDYFGIDCAEHPDGRLLLFEADVAMIVHDLDPEDVFPYKKPAMRRLFAAFQAELARAAR